MACEELQEDLNIEKCLFMLLVVMLLMVLTDGDQHHQPFSFTRRRLNQCCTNGKVV
jgi:hypothetical protein